MEEGFGEAGTIIFIKGTREMNVKKRTLFEGDNLHIRLGLRGMKMKTLAVVCVLLLSSVCAYTHSGRTDRSGGHHDHIRGGYHYHNSGTVKKSVSYSTSSLFMWIGLIYNRL